MPARKRRKARVSSDRFRYDILGIGDILGLHGGYTPDRFPDAVIKSEDDLRSAWECNRHLFMRLQQKAVVCNADGHPPGERPRCWWRFEAPNAPAKPMVIGQWQGRTGRHDYHEQPFVFLDRHGLLTAEERSAVEEKLAADLEHYRAVEYCACWAHFRIKTWGQLSPLDDPTPEQAEAWAVEQSWIERFT